MAPPTESQREREQRFRDADAAAYVGLPRLVRGRVRPSHAAESAHGGPDRPRRRRGRLLGFFVLGGAAAVAVPGFLLGGGGAHAAWTPTPAHLTGAAAARAATTCRAALGVPDRGERVAVAERRGGWTNVLLDGAKARAACLMPAASIGHDAAAGEAFFGSYDTDRVASPTVGPGGVDEVSITQGSTPEGWLVWVEGYVGDGVTGVTVNPASGPDLEASVVGHRFAAWWPTSRPSSAHSTQTWSYTVHLADGSTRQDRTPSR